MRIKLRRETDTFITNKYIDSAPLSASLKESSKEIVMLPMKMKEIVQCLYACI